MVNLDGGGYWNVKRGSKLRTSVSLDRQESAAKNSYEKRNVNTGVPPSFLGKGRAGHASQESVKIFRKEERGVFQK